MFLCRGLCRPGAGNLGFLADPDLADGTLIESSMDIDCLSPARGLGALLPPAGGPGVKVSTSPGE
jgi:hypothetical protein